MRLRQSVVYWELKFRRILNSPFSCPYADYKSLGAPRGGAGGEGEKGGRLEEEEGAGGRRCGGEGARSGSAGGSGRGRWR